LFKKKSEKDASAAKALMMLLTKEGLQTARNVYLAQLTEFNVLNVQQATILALTKLHALNAPKTPTISPRMVTTVLAFSFKQLRNFIL
jgi:hypothetical protein